jgi:predicted AlkP superfamily phosphohydrolase/phosphomutase
VLVIGLDAGTPNLLERWMADGSMPFLAGLARGGGSARLEGDELMLEEGLWLSLLSGRPRGEVGRHSYRQLVGAYDLALSGPAESCAVPMLWEDLARAGRRVAVFDVPALGVSHDVPATQVSLWGTHGIDGPLATSPPGLAAQVAAVAPKMELERDHVEGTNDRADREFLGEILDSVARRGRIARSIFDPVPDLAVAVFSETHSAGHRLWHKEDWLRDVYAAVDGEMALIANAMGEGAQVVVIAGSGLDRRGPVDALMADFCRALGYAPAPGGLRRPADVLARRAPRRARALAAGVLARPGINRVKRRRFSSACDWSRTRAFAIPDPFVGLIRVNLEGREPAGVVAPGAEYEQIVAELEQDLRALRDPRSGDAVIERVARARAADGGPPPRCPDVVATFKGHEPPLREIEHPRATIRQAEPWWKARNGHACRGVVIGAGSGESIACLDLAPMIRALVG